MSYLTKKSQKAIPWLKYAKVIKKSKVKTIKEFVARLQTGTGKKPLFKGISRDDAVDMLIDIGLSDLPMGSRFSEELRRHFKTSPEKINFKSFLAALEEISIEKNLDYSAAKPLKEIIKLTRAENKEDPFESNTPLSDHPVTAFAFRKTIMDEVGWALKLKQPEIDKLKKYYGSPDDLINSSNDDIKKKINISAKIISKLKDLLSWIKIEGVSVPLASALSTKLLQVSDVIKLDKRTLRKVVKESGISVPYRERTLKHLDQIVLSVRKVMPKVAYYHDVISSLKLPIKARTILKRKKVTSFDDLRRDGVLAEVIADAKITAKNVIASLNAHLSLSTLSVDVLANKKLIEKGFTSPARIAATNPKIFRKKMSGTIEDKKMDVLLSKASAQTDFLNNLHAGFKADRANRYVSSPLSGLFKEKDCQCRDCESAVSPLAYLADLLEYARKNVLNSGGDIDNAFLKNTLHQPFAALPATCEAMDDRVLQVKLCIEVLRSQLDSNSIPLTSAHVKIRNEGENTCRLSCYRALLIQIGTSFDELRLARSAPENERRALTLRLGLDIPARLDEMLLDTTSIKESDLVQLFGALHFGLTAKPTPKLETWRLKQLSAQWFEQDWPNEELDGGQPIIDPDIIGPDDFRNPFPAPNTRPPSPGRPFDIWLKRRKWVDQRLEEFNGRIDLKRMLEEMYTKNISYGPKTLPIWSNGSPVTQLVDLLSKVKTGTESEVEAATNSIATDLNLNVEAFIYLMTLHDKFNRATSDPRNEQLTDQEWREIYSILVQAHKRRFFRVWRKEEKDWIDTDGSRSIKISLKHFWNSEKEPSTDIWPPNVPNDQPLIDPDLLKINNLAERTVGKRARQYWKERKQEIIDDLSAPLEQKRIDYGLDEAIRMALGNPNPGDPLQYDLDALKTDLSSSDQVIVDDIKRKINDDLHLSIDEFGRLMTVKAKDAEADLNKKPTDSDWKDVNKMLTRAMKLKRKYPEWLLEEKGPLEPLQYWQAYKAKLEKWRASIEQRWEWRNILRLRSQKPIIDPDLIEIKSIKAPTKVLVLWNQRNADLEGWKNSLDDDRNAAATPLEGFDSIVNSTLNTDATELFELAEEEKLGYDIEPQLKQLSLTRPAFYYLFRIRRILEINEPVLTSEWGEVYSILIQVKKHYSFEQWREEEQKDNITLSPDYFIIPEPDPVLFPPPQPRELPKWRAKQTDLWDWQDTLQARIDQRDATISAISKAVEAAEESTLPPLRDALIMATGDGSTNLQQQANLLAKQLFIDTRAGGCKKTTRISQAIETIQGLLLALRTGQLKSTHPNIELDAPDFDEEWKWLGSYTTWRAIMFVFLYPENLLIPSLHRNRTEFFASCLDDLRLKYLINPADIIGKARSVKEKVDKWPEPKVKYVLKTADQSKVILIAQSDDNVYWSVAEESIGGTYRKNICWTRIPNFTGKLIYANSYSQPFENEDVFEYAYVFFKSNDLENGETEIGFVRCRINSLLEGLEVKLAGDTTTTADGYPYVVSEGLDVEWEKKSIRIAGSPEIVSNGYLIYVMDNCEDNIAQVAPFTTKVWDMSYYEISTNGILTECHLLGPVVTYNNAQLLAHIWRQFFLICHENSQGIIYTAYGVGTEYSLPCQVDISSLNHRDAYLGFLDFRADLGHVSNVPDTGSTDAIFVPIMFRNVQDGIPNVLRPMLILITKTQAQPRDWYGVTQEELEFQDLGGDKVINGLSSAIYDLNYYLLGQTQGISYAVFERENGECVFSSFIFSWDGGQYKLEWREVDYPVTHVIDWPIWTSIPEANPSLVQPQYSQRMFNYMKVKSDLSEIEYFLSNEEICYYLPLLFAYFLSHNGYYIEALDWYRTIYDYTAPSGKRKIYPGLIFEEDVSTAYGRSDDWLLDPLNPHAIAGTRANAYTRYTLFSIIRCLLDYADSEFTRDTAESLPRARRLYNTALEILDSPELQQKPSECDEIIGRLYIATGVEPWPWWAPEVFSKISKIKDTNQFRNTVENLIKIIKNDKTIEKRIGAAKELVADIDDRIPTIGTLLADRVQQTEQRHQMLLGQETIAGKTAYILDRYFYDNLLAKSSATLSFPLSAYEYCIPPNPVLQALRMRTEVNLYKLRTCRNIAGVAREIQAYDGPTDTVSGLPTIGVGGQLVLPGIASFPPSQYRYKTLIERAKQLVGIAKQMEASLLSIRERWSGGEYDILTARQNVQLTRAGNRLQNFRVIEAQSSQDLANLQQQSTQIRVDHYSGLTEAGNSTFEDLSLSFLVAMASAYTTASAAALAASFWGGPKLAAAGAQLAGQATQTWITYFNQMASYERRMQEWLFQKELAVQDIQIGNQQKRIAGDHVKVVEQESQIARLQAQNAEDVVEFLNEKFDNAELYNWMSRILTQVYAYFLQQATALSKVAANQLAFERQVPPPTFIQSDYWEAPTDGLTSELDEDKPDRKGLTGSARLEQDINKLDQYAFKTDERKLNLVKSISLAQLSPVEFQQFRKTGVMTFHTPMEIFDRDFPGHYLRLINKVRTSVIALIPPTEGIKATLTASRISRTVIGGDIFQTVQIHRGPDQVALTSPNDATGMFELDPHPEMLRPFEGIGVDTSWEFRLPKAANSFDFRSIADVILTIEYTALNSFTYRQQVIQQLRPKLEADRFISFRHQLPDQWYELHNPEHSNSPMVISFKTRSEDFPPNLEILQIKHVVLYFSRKDSETFEVPVEYLNFSEVGTAGAIGGGSETIDGVISTRRGNAGSWMSMIGKSPIGDWELALPDTPAIRQLFKDEQIEDILLVISYSGRTPEWPS